MRSWARIADGVLERAAEDEAALEGGEQVVGEGFEVEVDRWPAVDQRRAQQVEERLAPGLLGLLRLGG